MKAAPPKAPPPRHIIEAHMAKAVVEAKAMAQQVQGRRTIVAATIAAQSGVEASKATVVGEQVAGEVAQSPSKSSTFAHSTVRCDKPPVDSPNVKQETSDSSRTAAELAAAQVLAKAGLTATGAACRPRIVISAASAPGAAASPEEKEAAMPAAYPKSTGSGGAAAASHQQAPPKPLRSPTHMHILVIPRGWSDDDLRSLASPYGNLTGVRLDGKEGAHIGYQQPQAAQAALKGIHGQTVMGVQIRAEFSQKEDVETSRQDEPTQGGTPVAAPSWSHPMWNAGWSPMAWPQMYNPFAFPAASRLPDGSPWNGAMDNKDKSEKDKCKSEKDRSRRRRRSESRGRKAKKDRSRSPRKTVAGRHRRGHRRKRSRSRRGHKRKKPEDRRRRPPSPASNSRSYSASSRSKSGNDVEHSDESHGDENGRHLYEEQSAKLEALLSDGPRQSPNGGTANLARPKSGCFPAGQPSEPPKPEAVTGLEAGEPGAALKLLEESSSTAGSSGGGLEAGEPGAALKLLNNPPHPLSLREAAAEATNAAAPLTAASTEVVFEEGSPEHALQRWLEDIDGKQGAFMRYFDVLQNEFDCDFSQICAVKLPAPVTQGSIVGCIDPSFWEIAGVKALGHRLLLAKAIMALPG